MVTARNHSVCTAPNCDRPVHARGLCSAHLTRLYKHGDIHRVDKGGHKKHGLTTTIEYRHWGRMKERCYSVNHRSYPRYGGRGIKVCDRWLGPNGFSNFLADMGPKPSPEHTVDRIDSDKDYSPENCRWATVDEQNNNRGDYNVRLEVRGETRTVSEWAHHLGIAPTVLRQRLLRGWSAEEVVAVPLVKKGGKQVKIKSNAKLTPDDVRAIRESTEPHKVLAERYGVSRPHISGLKSGKFWGILDRSAA